jgi:hypothetical protein
MTTETFTTMLTMDAFFIAQPSEKFDVTFLITGLVLCTVPAMTFIAGMAWKQHTQTQDLYTMQKSLDVAKKDCTELREQIQVNENVIHELHQTSERCATSIRHEMQNYLDVVKKDCTELRELVQVNKNVIHELNEQLANNDVLVRNLVGNLNLPSTSDVGTQLASAGPSSMLEVSALPLLVEAAPFLLIGFLFVILMRRQKVA